MAQEYIEFIHLAPQVIRLIEQGESAEAELQLSNFYHAQRRFKSDYQQILRLITSHRCYIEADEHTKGALARILYNLDKRFNRFDEPICIARIGNKYRVMENGRPR